MRREGLLNSGFSVALFSQPGEPLVINEHTGKVLVRNRHDPAHPNSIVHGLKEPSPPPKLLQMAKQLSKQHPHPAYLSHLAVQYPSCSWMRRLLQLEALKVEKNQKKGKR